MKKMLLLKQLGKDYCCQLKKVIIKFSQVFVENQNAKAIKVDEYQ